MWIPDAVLDHVRAAADLPDLSGTKYRLMAEIGRGGMGVVYAARDTELDRDVAIKVVADDRGRREARMLARLEHPSIVPVHDTGTLPDGRVYYVMKLVKGVRLDAWARGEPDLRARLRMFERVCEGVAFAHANGVLHRDLKPENVMVGAFGEALVMDWGIARDRAAPDPPGTIAGTAATMPPEQARGDSPEIDQRADVYSLGALLSFLIASRDAPKALSSICAKAMAPAPADRYASATELADDVARWLDALPVRAHREGALETAARFASRHRVVLSLLGAYVVVRVLLVVLAR